MLNNEFETFANKLCEYCMTKYVLPYMREHGMVMSYRATIISIDTSTKTMVVERPFDTQITVPYSNMAEGLKAGDNCIVLSLGDSSNSVIVTDSMFNNYNRIWYGTSSTAAATAAKVVSTLTGDFILTTGAMVRVKFANATTYNGTATLNVDGTGAKDISRIDASTTITSQYFWTAGEVVDFVYDGTRFIMSDKGAASTTYYGMTKLLTSVTSTVNYYAATPAAVKQAYDRAARVPDPPTTAGTYTLQCTVNSGGTATYSWV